MKDFFANHTQAILWVVAFVCVSVLVGIGKIDPKTIEYLLMGLAGTSVPGLQKAFSNPPGALGSGSEKGGQ